MADLVRATAIPAGPGTSLGDFRINAAVEVRCGRAVVVIARHADGRIGIGNAVQGRSESDDVARDKCLAHALARIASMEMSRTQ